MKTAVDLVTGEAEIMGMNLSPKDAQIIADKWLSDPLCTLDALLSGIQQLNSKSRLHSE
jgi:hypothetical protein